MVKIDELIIRNGVLITESGRINADIRIIDEKIHEIGPNLNATSSSVVEIDAGKMIITPGGIDPHVHLSLPPSLTRTFHWADDFESGSKAALAGGITTLGCISVPGKDETLLQILERETVSIREKSIADFMIHPVVIGITEKTVEDIPKLIENGCSTIKIFMVTDDYDNNEALYKKAIQAAKNSGMLAMVHCEDNEIIKETQKQMLEEGKKSLQFYAESRPVTSETVAVQKMINISTETGAPIYIVHLSSEAALKICEKAQADNIPVFVEGRPIFLNLTSEKYLEPGGALYVVQPPLREQSDVEALWKGLQNGSITTLATDHAPHKRETKLNPDLDITKLAPGVNELQVMLPMFYANAVGSGKITLEKFVEVTSTNVAKLFGLYPRKGTIKVGSDADLVIWDIEEERMIRNEDMYSQAGFSIYHGESYIGWPKVTIRRGEIVYEDKKIVGSRGSGIVIDRKPMQTLFDP